MENENKNNEQEYQGQQYQGQSYQGQPFYGQPYQGQPYQGQPYYGQPYQGQQSQQPGSSSVSKPDTNLVWGILTTIMCCLPFGLVSIVYASKVDTLWFAGRYQEACNASNLAKKWALAAAITTIVVFALYVIIMMIAYGI